MEETNEETKDGSGAENEAPEPSSIPTPQTPEPASDAAAGSAATAAAPSGDASGASAPKASIMQRIKLPDNLGRSGIVAIVLGVLVVLLALMLFAPGIMPLKLGAARTASNANTEQDIKAVAGRFAKNLLTFDYRRLDKDLDRIGKDATGTFEKEFSGVSAISGNVVEAKAISKGETQGVSVTSRSGDSATVLVFLKRTIQNKSQTDPRAQFQFLELTLVHTSSGWKVDDVKDPTLAGL